MLPLKCIFYDFFFILKFAQAIFVVTNRFAVVDYLCEPVFMTFGRKKSIIFSIFKVSKKNCAT